MIFSAIAGIFPGSTPGRGFPKKRKGKELICMSEKELDRLYDLLETVQDPDTASALRHAIFILEMEGK